MLIRRSLVLYDIYSRNLRSWNHRSRRKLPSLDFHIRKLPTNPNNKYYHIISPRNLRLRPQL
jgi:hypothetical protein